MHRIRVGLLDDHRVVLRALRSYLEAHADLEVVGEATSGVALLRSLKAWAADVLVIDLLLPGGIDGLETIRRARVLCPAARAVVLTAFVDADRAAAARRLGALGYVRKDSDPEMLVHAIRCAAAGRVWLDPQLAGLAPDATGPAPESPLTLREREVLEGLARGHTNREIAAGLGIGEETVKTHVSSLLAKLHLADRRQAALHALKQRLVSLDEL